MKLKAFAKINLFLEITGKRNDGYHNLFSVMQEIDIHDELEISILDNSNEIQLTVLGDIKVPNDENNLIIKTAKLLQRLYSVEKGAKIILTKNIPIGAGLGGGSSDAASVLKALNVLWNLNLPTTELKNIGKKIGADVPFFLYGGRCVVEGIGDIITPIPDNPNFDLIVVYPRINISTKTIYETFKLTNIIKKCSISQFYNQKNNSLNFNEILFNRLEEPAFYINDNIRSLKENLTKYSNAVLMSGSGSAVYAINNDKKLLEQLYNDVNKKGYWAKITKTV